MLRDEVGQPHFLPFSFLRYSSEEGRVPIMPFSTTEGQERQEVTVGKTGAACLFCWWKLLLTGIYCLHPVKRWLDEEAVL